MTRVHPGLRLPASFHRRVRHRRRAPYARVKRGKITVVRGRKYIVSSAAVDLEARPRWPEHWRPPLEEIPTPDRHGNFVTPKRAVTNPSSDVYSPPASFKIQPTVPW